MIRHYTHLLVVVYKSMSRIHNIFCTASLEIPSSGEVGSASSEGPLDPRRSPSIYIYIYIYIYTYTYIHRSSRPSSALNLLCSGGAACRTLLLQRRVSSSIANCLANYDGHRRDEKRIQRKRIVLDK